MTAANTDIIDFLVGITPGSKLDVIRAQRPQARENAQKSYLALFAPAEPGDATAAERHALASFVAGLHREAGIAQFYAAGLPESGDHAALAKAIAAETVRGADQGPYGHWPKGKLSAQDEAGPELRVLGEHREALGRRLAASFEHAHMLVFHPRDASRAHLQALLDAGWSTTGIVTLSQLVAFLAFQIRVVSGLRTLAATSVHAGGN